MNKSEDLIDFVQQFMSHAASHLANRRELQMIAEGKETRGTQLGSQIVSWMIHGKKFKPGLLQ